MAERTPYPERGNAPAAAAPPPQEESLYEEMLRYQNENNIEDETDVFSSKSRRRKKEARSKSPPPPSDGTPGSRSGNRKGASRSTPTSGRKKNQTSSGRRSPMNVSPSVSSDNRKKPGIVSVDQPAIHPNSAMYHAAYSSPAPAPAPPPSINTAAVVEATPVRLSGSGPIDPSPNTRARSPTRFDAPQATQRGISPRMDTLHRPRAKKPEVIDALCVSAHNPTRPAVKPMDPLSASEHNPMFFASVDEKMQTSQIKKKEKRSKSPMMGLDAIGKPMFDAIGKPLDAIGKPIMGLGSALGFSQHKEKKNKPKRVNSADSTDLDLDTPKAFDKTSRTRSKSPKLGGGRSRNNSVPHDVAAPPKASPPTRKGSVLVEEMPQVSPNQVEMSTPNMPVFSQTNRNRGPVGAPRERGGRGGSVEPKPDSHRRRGGSVEPKEDGRRRRGGSVEPKEDGRRRRGGSVEPKEDGRRRRGGSVEPKEDGRRRRGGSVEPKEDGRRRRGGSVEPKEDGRRRRGGSVEPKPESSRSKGKRTHSKSPGPSSRRERSPIRSTPESTKKKPAAPTPNLDRPGITGRAATTGSSAISSESSGYSHSSTPSQQQLERASSDQPPSSHTYQRRTSTSQEQMDADLMLALELSQRDAQEQSAAPPPAARPDFQKAPPKSSPRVPSPKRPPTQASAPRPPPATAEMPPASSAARKPQPVGLGDHFARSDFASAASTAGTDDESSLADVLYALKISAEEEAARKRTELASKTMTSIQELLELEANDRRRHGGSSDDDDEEEDFESSVMDLVAAGISAKSPPESPASTNDDTANQKARYEQMQAEEEQRQLELALKASEAALEANEPPAPQNQVDADLKMALEVSRDELDLDGATDRDFMLQQQRAMEQFAARKAQKETPLDHERGRNSLVQRGTAETQRAVSAGKAHIVTCRGCQARLQAPIAYSLVFCPNCQTVSPTGV